MNLTKPSKRLEIFYSRVSSDGKSLRPSYLIQEIRRLYPDLALQDEEAKGFGEREWTEGLGLEAWIHGLAVWGEVVDSAWMELHRKSRVDPAWKEKTDRLLDAGFYRRPSDPLTEETARRLYGEKFEDSITRIERFSSCAFAHFLTYGLRLKERQEYDFQAVDLAAAVELLQLLTMTQRAGMLMPSASVSVAKTIFTSPSSNRRSTICRNSATMPA